MIPCHGTHGSRHQINNKSIQEEYKIWVLVAEAYGYVVQLRLYKGAKKGKQVALSARWELGENLVLPLMECLSSTFSFDMDNYFTSFCLLIHLGVNNIRATPVLNKNRLSKCTTIGDKQLQKKKVVTLCSAYQAKKQGYFNFKKFIFWFIGLGCVASMI